MKIFVLILSLLAVSLFPLTASSQEGTSAAPAKQPAKTDADKPLGLNVDLGINSAYVFRGLNVFQKDGQMDQHMMAAPGVSWSIGDTGLTIGYWSAYQITGDNRGDNTDAGLNIEQDLYVSYEKQLDKKLTIKGLATLYVYPLADLEDVSIPAWIEPMVGAAYSLPFADVGLSVGYFFGIDSGLRDFSYLYVNPTISKSFKIMKKEVGVNLGYGYKQFKGGNEDASNVHDVLFTVNAKFDFSSFYVKPGVGVAWTNIEGEESTFSDGFVVWAFVNVGFDK